jgi:hypothetical protein
MALKTKLCKRFAGVIFDLKLCPNQRAFSIAANLFHLEHDDDKAQKQAHLRGLLTHTSVIQSDASQRLLWV